MTAGAPRSRAAERARGARRGRSPRTVGAPRGHGGGGAPILGAHESIAGGMDRAIERGQQATCDAVQVFDKANNQWRARALEAAELEAWFAAQLDTGVTAACAHASYLINLASPEAALREKSYQSFREEVERCAVLGIPNLVFHPGAHVGSGEAAGMDRVAASLDRLFAELGTDTGVAPCLEVTAGTGSNLGSTFEQLAGIIDRVDERAGIGVCLDTCHLFAAGYPLADAGDYRRTMARFDEVVGLHRLRVIHLNDSKTPLGSRRDRHEHIGRGYIGLEGFRNAVNDPRLRQVPMILETPKGQDLAEDARNLAVLRALWREVA